MRADWGEEHQAFLERGALNKSLNKNKPALPNEANGCRQPQR